MNTVWGRVGTAAAVLVGLFLLSNMVLVVDPAEVAVVYRFGAVDRVLDSDGGFFDALTRSPP
jgi:regulator of protease activity HflC (stomatin/prohibitin superfamily)